MRIVIIGNGVAGIEAALAVRRREPKWQITILSEESDHFFSRTALMWVMSGQMSHEDIEPYERDLYARMNFERVRARAIGIDVAEHCVRLAGEVEPIRYDRLLIACGSKPRNAPWPGSDLDGVGHFVTLQDLEWLEQEVHGSRGKGRPPRADYHLGATDKHSPYLPRAAASVARGSLAREPAVIGGGLIGIEAVEVFVAAGLKPRFFIREEWFWPIAIEARESKWITARMREHGVQVHLEHEIHELLGDAEGRLKQIGTNRGRYATDCVVIAIGVVPNTEWLQDSDVVRDARGGIIVASGLETSAPDVYAAGDCASVRWFDGSVRPEQLWYTARDQGRVAGKRLLGQHEDYTRGPWYNSAKLMDVEYTTAGFVNRNLAGEANWFFEEEGKVRSTTRIVVQDGRVVGFNLLGRRWDHRLLLKWIEEERDLRWVIDHLGQASFDTEFVPALRIPQAARAQPALALPEAS